MSMMKATLCYGVLLALTSTALCRVRPIMGRSKPPLQGTPFEEVLPYIAGGTDASHTEFPYVGALLLYNGPNLLFWCGLTLYTPNKALTAAHCLTSGYQNYAVAFGFIDFKLPPPQDQSVQFSNLTAYRIHPDYDENVQEHPNDLGVVFLEQPMELSSAIGSIPLARNGSDFVGEDCTVTGWGQTSQGSYPDILQKADMTVISEQECTTYFPNYNVTSRDVCTLSPGKSACIADSGSPMVCQGQLKGIVSLYQGDCSGSEPSIFTRITSYLDWIYQQ